MQQCISLNGTWDFVADLDPKYHAAHTGFRNPAGNRRHGIKAPVPGVWQKYDGERYDLFEGVCRFAREFEVSDLPPRARVRLRFGGANYLANVYLNGESVGGHEGGYTEFVLDVTGRLKAGVNHLAVQVDNRALITKWPPVLGYFNYGGIHRGVSLEIADGPTLEGVRLEAVRKENGWELAVSGRLDSLDSLEGLRLREILALAEEHPRIVGTFPFCFSDYRDPSKIPNGGWNELNLKGIVDYARHPKRAYAAVTERYAKADRPCES